MQEIIDTNCVSGRLNSKLHAKFHGKSSITITWVNPRQLIDPARADVMIKVMYAQAIVKQQGCAWLRDAYLEHIDRINGFVEADGSGKVGPEAFDNHFLRLIESMKTHGFDKAAAIPVTERNILDGAHRLAAALALNLQVPTIQIPNTKCHELGWQKLRELGVNETILQLSALQYVELNSKCRIVILWPSTSKLDEVARNIISQNGVIVFSDTLTLRTEREQANIMRICYRAEPWLGSGADEFSGAKNKARMCFQSGDTVQLLVVESDADWLALKDEIRRHYGAGKHSVHITDAHDTIEIARVLLSPGGREWIMASQLTEFPWFQRVAKEYSICLAQEIANGEICLVGGAVLASFGLRETRDIDFISEHDISTNFREIGSQNEEWVRLNFSPSELLNDPTKFFWLDGQKVMTLSTVSEMKSRRGESKDVEDVQLINTALAGGQIANRQKKPVTLKSIKAALKFRALKIRFLLMKALSKLKNF